MFPFLWVSHHVVLLLSLNNTFFSSTLLLLRLTSLFYDSQYVIIFLFLWVPLHVLLPFHWIMHSSTRLLQLTSLFYDSPQSCSITYVFSLISQFRWSMFTSMDARSINCNTCGRSVEFKPCISNRNGNKGILFATMCSSPTYVIQVLK